MRRDLLGTAVALLAVPVVTACGFGVPPRVDARLLDPKPDGSVADVARGEVAGAGWSFGVYRAGPNVCTYLATDEAIQGPSCGPMLPDRPIGPFGAGGDLVGDWNYVGGVVAARVVRVDVLLEGGRTVEASVVPIDDVGLDAAAFFVPLEPGVGVEGVVARDAAGVVIERIRVDLVDGTEPPGPSVAATRRRSPRADRGGDAIRRSTRACSVRPSGPRAWMAAGSTPGRRS